MRAFDLKKKLASKIESVAATEQLKFPLLVKWRSVRRLGLGRCLHPSVAINAPTQHITGQRLLDGCEENWSTRVMDADTKTKSPPCSLGHSDTNLNNLLTTKCMHLFGSNVFIFVLLFPSISQKVHVHALLLLFFWTMSMHYCWSILGSTRGAGGQQIKLPRRLACAPKISSLLICLRLIHTGINLG